MKNPHFFLKKMSYLRAGYEKSPKTHYCASFNMEEPDVPRNTLFKLGFQKLDKANPQHQQLWKRQQLERSAEVQKNFEETVRARIHATAAAAALKRPRGRPRNVAPIPIVAIACLKPCYTFF